MTIEIKFSSAQKVKMSYMIFARDFIEESGLTQKQVANLVGCDQPRISDLINGKIDLFSIEWLLDLIDALKANKETA
jgi:predicted XRE-type DNA-binding protein